MTTPLPEGARASTTRAVCSIGLGAPGLSILTRTSNAPGAGAAGGVSDARKLWAPGSTCRCADATVAPDASVSVRSPSAPPSQSPALAPATSPITQNAAAPDGVQPETASRRNGASPDRPVERLERLVHVVARDSRFGARRGGRRRDVRRHQVPTARAHVHARTRHLHVNRVDLAVGRDGRTIANHVVGRRGRTRCGRSRRPVPRRSTAATPSVARASARRLSVSRAFRLSEASATSAAPAIG